MLLGADEWHVWCWERESPLAPASPTPPPPLGSPVWRLPGDGEPSSLVYHQSLLLRQSGDQGRNPADTSPQARFVPTNSERHLVNVAFY